MSHYILAVCIPLPCKNLDWEFEYRLLPHGTVEQKDGTVSDGHFDSAYPIEYAWSQQVDATPYAWVDLAGTWHEKPEEEFPEVLEVKRQRQKYRNSWVVQNSFPEIEEVGTEKFKAWHVAFNEAYEQAEQMYPTPKTAWDLEWEAYCAQHACLVIFCDCHA